MAGTSGDEGDGVDAVGLLADDTRRALYEHVVRSTEPVSRDDAARAVGVDRSVAAYHLEKLLDEGLLSATFSRPAGRGGPGAGRPTKYYERSDTEFAASAPPRDYRLIAELLARAFDASPADLTAALRAVAREFGSGLTRDASGRRLWDLLEAQGYQPFEDGEVIRLRNCPFHRLAQEHTQLVCGLNQAMMEGILERGADRRLEAVLDPAPGRCCVAFRPH